MTAAADHFPPDYPAARARFRAAPARLGWAVEAHPVPGTGPAGEDLTIDAAVSPDPAAGRVLVVSGGLHGAEGPFGSAVQLAVMDRWATRPPPAGVRYVFLHALNPHGYAWGRRVDADNVDPNRNFLLPGQEYRGSPDGYKHFDSLLNPPSPPRQFDTFVPRAWLAVARHGVPALKQSLATGQYDYPKGIFFGGHGPTATHRALAERLRGWVGPAADVVHLDFHAGLGRFGTYKLLLDAPATASQRDRLDRWFGPDAYEEDDPRKTSYMLRGGLGPWCVAQGLAPEYLYLVAEFGTYGNVTMLAGLRQENRAVHWGRAGDRWSDRAKARLRELFCPASPAWRERVLTRGVEVVMRGAEGLHLSPPAPLSAAERGEPEADRSPPPRFGEGG